MIGFVHSPHPKRRRAEDTLGKIVISKTLPKSVAGEWWVDRVRDGFTAFADALFRGRQPSSTDPQFRDVPVVKLPRRESEWDGQ